MDITPSNLVGFFQNFRFDYQKAFDQSVTNYEKFTTIIPSSSAANSYAWMDFFPNMRQWVGERVVNNAIARNIIVPNLDYELTVEIPRDTIEDDQYGIYAPRMAMMGRQVRLWPQIQVMKAVANAGTSAFNTYDGVPFFSNAHPIDASNASGATQSNLFALALTASNFATVVASAKNLAGRDGTPLGVFSMGQLVLMVPPALELTARQIVSSVFLSPTAAWGTGAASAPTSNVYNGYAEVLVNPYLTSTTAWYVFDCSMPMKPFVWQMRVAPQFTQRIEESSAPVFEKNVYQFGVRARGAPFVGPYFLAVQGST